MKFDVLYLYNFRNFSNVNIKFKNGINIIYGKNGSGKTNIIEALYLLAITKSFRIRDDKVLIKNEEKECKISSEVIKDDKYNLSIKISNNKKLFINNDLVTKLSEYISTINVILYEPNDQFLLKTAPYSRRKLLDIEISQLNKKYLYNLNIYNKLLKQRNVYLKNCNLNNIKNNDYLKIITNKLINIGYEIYLERSKFIENINKNIGYYFKNIAGYGNLIVKYNSIYNNKSIEDISKLYESKLINDYNYKKTSLGIQIDDFDFILDDINMKEYSSVGEQKTAILSFKLSEIDIFKNNNNFYPILLLDDIFSELDSDKIKNLSKFLNKDIQTIITSAEDRIIENNILNNSNIIYVENGTIKEKNNE